MIGAEQIARMKDGVRLINVARGGIIEEAALAEAVKTGKVAGAAIDVCTAEPPGENPLLNDPRIIIRRTLVPTTEGRKRGPRRNRSSNLRWQTSALRGQRPNAGAGHAEGRWAYMAVAETIGSVATQLVTGKLTSIEIDYFGEIADFDVTPLKASVIRG
jgi:D-3-phosphoglycerate dehydrogenase